MPTFTRKEFVSPSALLAGAATLTRLLFGRSAHAHTVVPAQPNRGAGSDADVIAPPAMLYRRITEDERYRAYVCPSQLLREPR